MSYKAPSPQQTLSNGTYKAAVDKSEEGEGNERTKGVMGGKERTIGGDKGNPKKANKMIMPLLAF